MNKNEFIEKLYKRHEGEFKGSEGTTYIGDCNLILPENGVDYEALYLTVVKEHKYRSAPTTQWLCDVLPKCKTYNASNDSEGIGHINCLLNGQEYKFAYLKGEMNCNQAMTNLRKQMEEKGHTVSNIALVA